MKKKAKKAARKKVRRGPRKPRPEPEKKNPHNLPPGFLGPRRVPKVK